ncbi:MAG TPA: C39 family peptidase [Thermoanaerobaculia bacterium]|nr:C39 family peptidase [Thermoanaerobaculia bacterium]
MAQVINRQLATRLAGLELNALIAAGAIPHAPFEDGRVSGTPTPVYDLNGEVLFHRVPVRGRAAVAFVDIAASDVFGATLLRVSHGLPWNPKELIAAAEAAAKKRQRGFRYDDARFVAYSYPKVGVQFLAEGKEVILIELGSWTPVPPRSERKKDEPPGNFDRYSLIEEYPPRPRDGEKRVTELLRNWEQLPVERFDPRVIDPDRFRVTVEAIAIFKTDTRRVAYSPITTDHVPCFELRGQITNVWCVAASVQMILDFYRYNYDQVRIASELGLGTISSPNGLPYSRDNDVVVELEQLTSNALDANMNTSPSWTEFRNEVRANRPLISFVPGHSRCVAGYTATSIFSWYSFRGLLVYDPWPPSTGVITQWENFDATTYRRTFTAHVTLV